MALKMVANSVLCGTSEVTIYETASNTRAQIIRLSVANNGSSSTWFSVFVHPASGTSAPIINRRVILRYVTDNCIELIGHELMPKARLTVISGGSVNVTLTVDE